MSQASLANYLFDLGGLLKSAAIEAAQVRDSAPVETRPFHEGMALGYISSLSLILDQARSFDISPSLLQLDNFDPDSLH